MCLYVRLRSYFTLAHQLHYTEPYFEILVTQPIKKLALFYGTAERNGLSGI
jgi:hypothetical protein